MVFVVASMDLGEVAEPCFKRVTAATIFVELGKYGGHTWVRTKDPLIKSQLLYQLSYASISAFPQKSRIVGSAPYSHCLQ